MKKPNDLPSILSSNILGQSPVSFFYKLKTKGLWRSLIPTSIRILIITICGLINTVIFARFLSKEIFGYFTFIISILGLMEVIALPGLNVMTIKLSQRGETYFYVISLFISFIGSVVGSLLLLALWQLHPHFLSHIPFVAYAVMAAAFPFYTGLNMWRDYLIGKNLFLKLSVFISVETIIQTVFTVLAVIHQLPLAAIIATYLGTYGLCSILFVFLTFPRRFTKKDMTEKVWKGVHLSWINFIPKVANSLDRFLIGIYLGPIVLANYAIASVLTETVRTHIRSITNTIFPHITSKSKAYHFRFLKQYFAILTLFGLTLAMIVWYAAPYIVPFLYGAKYDNTVFFVRLMSITLILRPGNRMIFAAAVFNEDLKSNFYLNTLPTLCRFASYPFILEKYGIIAIPFTIVIEELVYIAIGFNWLRRIQN